jgi:hypothetical protein
MGKLLEALTRPSAYRAKKTDVWETITDRIAGAMYPAQLREVEDWIAANELSIPDGWLEPIEELIEKRRDEIQAEDISQIMRDRFDF